MPFRPTLSTWLRQRRLERERELHSRDELAVRAALQYLRRGEPLRTKGWPAK